MKEIKTLKPFTRFLMTIGELPSSYLISMTYEEQLLWFCNYLQNTVIPALNNNAEAVIELQNLYNELKNYVDNYFESLDVQEEINNKLDEMASDGTLDNIINQEIFGEITSNIDLLNTEVNTLNKKDDLNKINLENLLIYDSDHIVSTQGICTNDNLLYMYQQTTHPYGNLLIFNIETRRYVGKIENLKLYHGNDMVCINNKIYVASTGLNTSSDDSNKKICIYDINNDTLEEIDPFSETDETHIFGISKYDNNNLICALKGVGQNFNTIKFYILNISNYEYNTLTTTNTKNLQVNYWNYLQSMHFNNNKIYITSSQPNGIIELSVDNGNANLEKIYNIDNVDSLGLQLGEIEGITDGSIYGENTFIINTDLKHYDIDFTREYKLYLININSSTPLLLNGINYNSGYNYGNDIVYVNNSNSDELYENGSEAYPFKRLNRAIGCANNCKFNPYLNNIRITGGSNYILDEIRKQNFIIENYSNSNVTLLGKIYFGNSNAKLDGRTNRFTVNIQTDIRSDKSETILKNCDFNYVGSTENRYSFIQSTNGSKLIIDNCTIDGNSQIQFAIRSNDESFVDMSHNVTISNITKKELLTSGNALNIVPASYTNNNLNTTSPAVTIKGGSNLGF